MAASTSIIAGLWWRWWRSSVDRPGEKGRQRRAPSRVRKITIRSIFQSFEDAKEELFAGERKREREEERKCERMICEDRGAAIDSGIFVLGSYVTLESCYHRTCQGNERGEFVQGVESPSTCTRSLKQLIHHINPVNSEKARKKQELRK